MPTSLSQHIMARLNECREELIPRVAAAILPHMPMALIPEWATDKMAIQRQHMQSTARRFHDIVQAGVLLDWSLVAAEFAWASGVLMRLGITWEHQECLITSYFTEVLDLPDWTPEEQHELERIAQHLRVVARAAYCTPPLVLA